jgi:hypothetical protein
MIQQRDCWLLPLLLSAPWILPVFPGKENQPANKFDTFLVMSETKLSCPVVTNYSKAMVSLMTPMFCDCQPRTPGLSTITINVIIVG